MSKFYIKTNRVVADVHEISARKDLNAYVKGVINSQQTAPYAGALIRRKDERDVKESPADLRQLPTRTEKELG